MKISVTQEHINNANSIADNDWHYTQNTLFSCSCPISLALRDTFKVKWAQVTYNSIDIGMFPEDNISFRKNIPIEAFNWIKVFDEKGRSAVKPFDFELSMEGVQL